MQQQAARGIMYCAACRNRTQYGPDLRHDHPNCCEAIKSTCGSCVLQAARSMMKLLQTTYPCTGYGQDWGREMVQRLCPFEFHEHENIVARNHRERSPYFRWCRNEESGRHGQIHFIDSKSGRVSMRKVICSICATENCYKCESPWHEGMSCDDFQASPAVAPQRYAEVFNWRRCPYCQEPIKRNTKNVSHTCSACHNTFDWELTLRW